jgi:peptidyl-prolyl cis-trans isomerase D
MLQFIRSKAGSFAVKILFVLLIGSFGIWGIGDILRLSSHESSVITVGSTAIKEDQVQAALQKMLQGARRRYPAGLDLAQAKTLGLVDGMVDNLVTESLLDEETAHLGIRVGSDETAYAIAHDPGFKGTDGQFDRFAFINAARSQGLSPDGYAADITQRLKRYTLASVAQDTAKVPATLAEMIYKSRRETRVADWVLLPTSLIKDPGTPDAAALQIYYDQHHERFTAPEYRRLTALVLLPSDVDKDVVIDDAALKDAYDKRAGDYTTPERRHVLQMLLPDQKAAEKAAADVAGGRDFAEVAKTEAKQAADTIDLGTVTKTDLAGALADAAFAAKSGEVSAPIESPLGWTLVLVKEITPGGVRKFDEVKADLTAALRKEQEEDLLYKLSEKVSEAAAAGAELGAIAEQFGLKPLAIPEIDATGNDRAGKPVPIPEAARKILLKSAFATSAGQIGEMEEDQASQAFAIVKVEAVVPPTLQSFQTVEPKVRDLWLQAARDARLVEEAKALQGQIGPSLTLAKLAGQRKLTVTTTKPFTRDNQNGAAQIPPALVGALFALKRGETAIAAGPGGEWVAQLTDIIVPDPTKDPNGLRQIDAELERALGADQLDAFDASLKQRFPVTIRQAELDRLTSSSAP